MITTPLPSGTSAKVVKRRSLVMKTGIMQEFLHELIDEVIPLTSHLFVKDWQHKQLMSLKGKLPSGAVLSVLDFLIL